MFELSGLVPLLGLLCSLPNAPICNSQVIIVDNCYMHCASGNKKLSIKSCQNGLQVCGKRQIESEKLLSQVIRQFVLGG